MQKSQSRPGRGRKSSRSHAVEIADHIATVLRSTPSDRLVARRGDDRLRLGEVEELHAGGTLAEGALAEQGVHVDAAQALRLPELARDRAGLVVGDDELAVLVELEPVDHAAEAHPAEVGFELELQPDRPHRAGVFEREVALDEQHRVGVELRPLLVGEHEVGEIGVGGELDPGAVEVERARRRACARRVGDRAAARAPGAPACPWWSSARAVRAAARGRRTGTRAGTP